MTTDASAEHRAALRAKIKISVAMCTCNGARFIAEQLASISAQTRWPDELVICDDCSTDATPGIVQEFIHSAPFPVRLEVNDRTLGSTKNFERAIGLCTGDIIALADQDDVWLPHKLALFEARFMTSPRVGMLFSDAEVVDEGLRPLGHRLWERVGFGAAERHRVRHGRGLEVLLPGWTVTGATMAFRAEFRTLVLDIPDNLGLMHDGWIALIVAAVADVDFVEEPLVKYRQHQSQQIGAPDNKQLNGAGVGGFGRMLQAARRLNSYNESIEIATKARQRLAARRGSLCERALSELDARLTHLRVRADLPKGWRQRAGAVLTELGTRRYHRYGNGVYSAVKDLLALNRKR